MFKITIKVLGKIGASGKNRGQFSHCYIRKKGDRKMQRKYL
jgi:hypothetical protein